jgi:HD-GYP domain-containing protein (c-di-GMP phosphodiesterase class II)
MDKGTIDSLRTLHDLSKAINSTLNIEEVVELVLEKTSRVMGAGKVLILLLDRERRTLTVHSSLGFEEGELGVKQFSNVGSFDHCIVDKGTVITLKEILPEDYYLELVATTAALDNMVFAPLEIKGEAYGLLGILDSERSFSRIEIEIFCSLGSQSAVAMENANLYRKLKDAFLHTAEALAEAINSRDPYTGGHTRRTVDYSLLFADALGLSEKEKETLKLAAILHDIGKIGIDDAILRKGGLLSNEEELKMREHPEIGARILGFVEEMVDVMPGVRHHHERFDGNGYPEGLKGEDIPLQARIIAITDAFDALTTDRPYKSAMDEEAALEELSRSAGSHFDPVLVETFCRVMREGK